MKYKHLLLSTISIVIVSLNSNIASADNGIVFPPSNAIPNYRFPPQAPISPRFVQPPRSPTSYVFGQKNNQSAMMPRARQMPNINRFPAQYPTMPSRNFQPRSYNPSYNARNNQYYNRNSNNGLPFSNNIMPFGNSGNNSFNPFSNNGNMPFSPNNFSGNPMSNMFGNNSNGQLPFFKNSHKTRKKAWGSERNIWPDFYTDFTDDAWDTVTSGPRDLGEMPGGWRFPYISTPDPVTVSDAITNQFPPILEEGGKMADFSDWGVFDNK